MAICSTLKKPRTKILICSCCGSKTRGRQWYNRDTGYGTCDSCIKWLENRGEDVQNIAGIAGIHHSLKTIKAKLWRDHRGNIYKDGANNA